MFGNLGNLAGLLKSARELQGNLAKMQEELANRRYEGEAGGGLVRATVDGKAALVDIAIDPKATSDVELLEEFVKASVGAAVSKAQEGMKNELAGLTGGMDLSALSGLLGGGKGAP